MSDAFNPYYKWLGIPPSAQPPNHYQLLGLQLFEPDPEVIETAADRQMVHLRRYQTGPYATLSQRLLNEVSSARLCLLQPDKKAAYDQGLWQWMQTQALPSVSEVSELPPSTVPASEAAEALADWSFLPGYRPAEGQELLVTPATGPDWEASVEGTWAGAEIPVTVPPGPTPNTASADPAPSWDPAARAQRGPAVRLTTGRKRADYSVMILIGILVVVIVLLIGLLAFQEPSSEKLRRRRHAEPSAAAPARAEPAVERPFLSHAARLN